MSDWISVALREDFTFKKQFRRDQASARQKQKNISAFDFETSHGDVVISSFSWFDEETEEYIGEAFDHRENPYNLKRHIAITYAKMGRVHTRTEKKKRVHRMAVPMQFAYNLGFEQGSMLKTLPKETIDYLRTRGGAVIDIDTGEIDFDIVKEKGRWIRESGRRILSNKFVALFFIPKKMLKIEPIFWRTNIGDKKNVRLPKINIYDIAQYYGGSLDKNAEEVLGENKVDGIDRSMLGSNDPDHSYWVDNWEHIWEYAVQDAVLTAKLSWLKVKAFEDNGVRMNKPISCAFVAEQSVYDLCHLPELNGVWKNRPSNIKQAWTAYQGGWFETTGTGYIEDVRAYDLASAYPHVMWWLPDWNGGIWFDDSDFDDPDEKHEVFMDYIANDHKQYRIAFCEAFVDFPDGLEIYPASKGRKPDGTQIGTVVNAQFNLGWFTGDEIAEFVKWGAEIVVNKWFYHTPQDDWDTTKNDVGDDGVRYPLRPFIEVFYGMKLEQAALKDTPEFNQDAYNVSKVMINSVYGKLMSMVEDKFTRLGRTGNMWNSMWAALTTSGCRMRLAEFIRLNGTDSILSCATDGVIVKGDNIVVPENPAPVYFESGLVNLGDWEDDGEGNLLVLMSGVYSIIKGNKTKSTYRGNYSLFIGRNEDDYFPTNWVDFCVDYAQETEVVRDADNQPFSRPYSLGEAGVRKDYSLVNDFRVVKNTVRAMGDSNKRSWHNCDKPTTFGNLTERWYVSNPHTEAV